MYCIIPPPMYYLCKHIHLKDNTNMKKILTLMAMTFCFFSLKAENAGFEPIASVENSYIEEVLADNYLVTSKLTDRDYLISTFIAENQRRFYPADMIMLKDDLQTMSDTELITLASTNFKNPTVSMVLSVLLGGLGADRFYIGNPGLGVLKLITGGGLGIWWIVDMCIIMDKTKEANKKELAETLMLQNAMLGSK